MIKNKIPLDGGTVTDKCINGLPVKTLTQNLRGIGFDSYSRLKLYSYFRLRWSKNIQLILIKIILRNIVKHEGIMNQTIDGCSDS